LLPQAPRRRGGAGGHGDPRVEPAAQVGQLGAAGPAPRLRPRLRGGRGGAVGRMEAGMSRLLRVIPLGLLTVLAPRALAAAPVRAAYFYDYMSVDHLDSLAHAGFGRAIVHWITDSLGVRGAAELNAFCDHAAPLGIEIEPEWPLQAPQRLAARPPQRRYTWGGATVESSVPCPLDSLYWRSALLDRAAECLAARPDLRRLCVDLELYAGSSRHHYDAGPCRCPVCLAEYAAGRPIA